MFVRTRSLSNAVTFSRQPISRPYIPRSRLTLHRRHRSCDYLIPDVPFPVGVRVCISSRFRDNGHRAFWGHDLDLSRSRDVIDQVTNRSAIVHLLLVVYWYQVFISKRFRDIRPQNPCAHTVRHTPQVILYFVPCNVLHWTDNNNNNNNNNNN